MSKQNYTVHFCNYNSIIVVNPFGKLRQLYTPFRVSYRSPKGQKRKWFIVDEVVSSSEDKLFFLINGNLYSHSDFAIEIQF